MIIEPEGNYIHVDVDDTLMMWDSNEYQGKERVEIFFRGSIEYGYPNWNMIATLIKFAHRGYRVVVHSKGGADWAAAVVQSLGLEDIVYKATAKPDYYFDDLKADEWMIHKFPTYGDLTEDIKQELKEHNVKPRFIGTSFPEIEAYDNTSYTNDMSYCDSDWNIY